GVSEEILQQSVGAECHERDEKQLIGSIGHSEQFESTQSPGNLVRGVGRTAPDQLLHIVEDQESAKRDQQLKARILFLNLPQQTNLEDGAEHDANDDCGNKQSYEQYQV